MPMLVKELPDIVGANAVAPLYSGTGPLYARGVILTALGSSNATVGDSSVNSTNGVHIPNAASGGLPLELPMHPDGGSSPAVLYDLTTVYVYVPSGTTVNVSYIPPS